MAAKKIIYPKVVKSKQAKKKYKERLLKENPEILYADYTEQEEKTNFIFHTDRKERWKSGFCKKYEIRKERTIDHGVQLHIRDNFLTHINIYDNGTVMIQGNEDSLSSFEKDFEELKAQVQQNVPDPLSGSKLEEDHSYDEDDFSQGMMGLEIKEEAPGKKSLD